MGIKAEKITPVYILCGNDDFTKNKTEDEIQEKLTKEYGNCERVILNGQRDSVRDIIEESLGATLFSPVKLLIIRNADKILNKEFKTFLTGFSERKDPPSILIIESREKSVAGLKDIPSHRIDVPYENKLPAWISQELSVKGKKISFEAASLLVFLCGRNLSYLSRELEKLAAAYPDKTSYDTEDVRTVTGAHKKNDIFAYLNALVDGDEKKSLLLLDNLLSYGAEPLQIIGMLKWKFQQMIAARMLMDKGRKENEIIRLMKLQPAFLYKGFTGRLKKFPLNKLLDNYDSLYRADTELKTGSADKSLVLEKFTLKFFC
jgi:DNA polymerase-3 subunit delta